MPVYAEGTADTLAGASTLHSLSIRLQPHAVAARGATALQPHLIPNVYVPEETCHRAYSFHQSCVNTDDSTCELACRVLEWQDWRCQPRLLGSHSIINQQRAAGPTYNNAAETQTDMHSCICVAGITASAGSVEQANRQNV